MLSVNGNLQLNAHFLCGDKSITHRALIFAALSDGVCTINNALVCRDTLATAECLYKLGAEIELHGTTFTVTPITTPRQNVILNAGNSGTTARLMAGVLAGLGVKATVIGDKSLLARPMKRVTDPLRQMGAQITDGDGTFLYKTNGGTLTETTITQTVTSAQVKSAVLLAGALANGVTYVENTSTRAHTEQFIANLGGQISRTGTAITVKNSAFEHFDYNVPCDFSSAAFLIAGALISKQELTLKNVCVTAERIGFLDVIVKSGAQILLSNVRNCFGEKIADVTVKNSTLQPFYATSSDVSRAIDELPVCVALALTVQGKHVFENVGELAFKESNRIDAISSIVASVGQKCTFDGTNLTVESDGNLTQRPFLKTFDDHRIAMSDVVLSSACGGAILDGESFDVSFPDFLRAVGVESPTYAVIGADVTNSLSPLLISALACSAGENLRYISLSADKSLSDKQLLQLIDMLDGLNVTMPFKSRVAKLLHSRFNSVNTVGREIVPQSTDVYGVLKCFEVHGIDFKDANVTVVGAGGAAEAVCQALAPFTKNVKIVNRTRKKAKKLARRYKFVKTTACDGIVVAVPECDFEKSLTLPENCKFVLNLNYLGTSHLACEGQKRGLTVIDGREMLFYQGKKSFELWTEKLSPLTYQQFLQLIEGTKNENSGS